MESDGWAVRVSTRAPSGVDMSQIYYARCVDPGAAESVVRQQINPAPHARVTAIEPVIGAVFDDLQIGDGMVGHW